MEHVGERTLRARAVGSRSMCKFVDTGCGLILGVALAGQKG